MPKGPRDHPLRQALTNEVHARPFARLSAPLRATHLALLSGEAAAETDRAQVARLCAQYDVAAPAQGDTHWLADFGAYQLKWERHTEFSTYSFFQPVAQSGGAGGSEPFAAAALALVPEDWLEALPGEMLAGVHLEMEPGEAPRRDSETLANLFGTDNIAGSLVSGGAAAVWMDFALHPDGFGRILVHDRGMRSRQAGRLVQRLFEIETYRMMALLALPMARRYGADFTRAGGRLTDITARMTSIAGLEDERRLLEELTGLSAQVEGMAAATSYRFSAARAYYALVRRRVEELREERVEGFQTLLEFVERRLAPAMRTCEAVSDRLDTLSRRITRAGELLRTRVDIQLEAQNSGLLRSMDQRARLQLRLQQTVEGLSVAAISYYLVGLVSYAAKAAKAAGLGLDVDIVTGLAIPVVVVAVGYGVWRVRRLVKRDADPGED